MSKNSDDFFGGFFGFSGDGKIDMGEVWEGFRTHENIMNQLDYKEVSI